MSMTEEHARQHLNDRAVLCCRTEAGKIIEMCDLEDPDIFDDLIDSGLLDLDGALTIREALGGELLRSCDSLTPLTKELLELTNSQLSFADFNLEKENTVYDRAVLRRRTEAGKIIEMCDLEDPDIFDDLINSGFLDLTKALSVDEVLGARLAKTCDAFSPLTRDVLDMEMITHED